MEKSLKQFAEEIKKIGLKGETKFKFACYDEGMITYHNNIDSNIIAELTLITENSCFSNMTLENLLYNPTEKIKYASFRLFIDKIVTISFSFNINDNPMFHKNG